MTQLTQASLALLRAGLVVLTNSKFTFHSDSDCTASEQCKDAGSNRVNPRRTTGHHSLQAADGACGLRSKRHETDSSRPQHFHRGRSS